MHIAWTLNKELLSKNVIIQLPAKSNTIIMPEYLNSSTSDTHTIFYPRIQKALEGDERATSALCRNRDVHAHYVKARCIT